MCRYCLNPYRQAEPDWGDIVNKAFDSADIRRVHQSLPEYEPTPLVSLPVLAESLGVGTIFVKDESQRFGLKAFKALGSSYAIYRFVCEYLEAKGEPVPAPNDFFRKPDILPPGTFTFCTATDGNHGRGVAWTAKKLRQRAVIFMPSNSSRARVENIKSEGARVVIVDGDYDKAVEFSAREAGKHNWQIISDTSWPGYIEIPLHITAGYRTMFEEIDNALDDVNNIDVVLVPGGVGALAGAASWYYNTVRVIRKPMLVAVEPTDADCLLESITSESGELTSSKGYLNSIMAGLNCGTPSLISWPLIKQGFDLFMTVSDEHCMKAMRTYFHPRGADLQIISGESGAATLAALMTLCGEASFASAKEALGLGLDSTVLLLSTEGDTDPDQFTKIMREQRE